MILQYSPSGSTSGVFSRRRSVLSDSPTLSARISSVIPCLRASLSAYGVLLSRRTLNALWS